MQGSRTKSGKDNEDEDVQITEEEPGENDDNTSNSPAIPIIKKQRNKLHAGDVIYPGTEINDKGANYHDNYNENNKKVKYKKHFLHRTLFSSEESKPSVRFKHPLFKVQVQPII